MFYDIYILLHFTTLAINFDLIWFEWSWNTSRRNNNYLHRRTEGIFSPASVRPSVCLFVSVLDYSRSYERILKRFSDGCGRSQRTEWLDSGRDPITYSRLYQVSFIHQMAGLVSAEVWAVSALLVYWIIVFLYWKCFPCIVSITKITL